MGETLFKRLRQWFCENILRHAFISRGWIYNGFYHRGCSVCKRTISEPVPERFERNQEYFEWRSRFAFLPIPRIVLDDAGFINKEGKYWLKHVIEVRVGLIPEWTAYASHNDSDHIGGINRKD